MTKLSIISPSALYDKMDIMSRDLLFYLSDDLVTNKLIIRVGEWD